MAENMYRSPDANLSRLELNLDHIIDSPYGESDIGENHITEYPTPSVSSYTSRNNTDIEQKMQAAEVQILEQPQPKALRFRYICEGRSAGSIPGVRSTPENKTFPKIKIVNYKGPAVVVVSCVTKDPPYRAHPHNLVGKEGCSKGVCTVTIDNDSMECVFSNLGIQCVKKKDVEHALTLREEIRVDPFGHGFAHKNKPQDIDLNAVRLCFQVFLNSGTGGKFHFPLKPVVSDPIYDKKAATDLNICKLSHCSSCVLGGKEVILLCDKVSKEDIHIRFYEEKDGHIEWEAFGDFQAADVHKQVAISFKTPKYKDIHIENSVNAFVQLVRPSDNTTSEPRRFTYFPMDADGCRTKRPRSDEGSEAANVEYDLFNTDARVRQALGIYNPGVSGGTQIGGISPGPPRVMKVAARPTRLSDDIKTEPPDYCTSPSPDPREVRTVTVSPQHTGGGLVIQNMHQNMHQVPLPHPAMPTHLSNPMFYRQDLPSGQKAMVEVPPVSPQQFYQVPSVYPLDHNQAPYSPENPAGQNIHLANQVVLPVNASLQPNIPFMPMEEETENHSLPDLGADCVNNLSDCFSCSLNLTDTNVPAKPQDKTDPSEEEKRSLMTPNNFNNAFVNSPNCNTTQPMPSEDAIPAVSSDSIKHLKADLEDFKKLSERG